MKTRLLVLSALISAGYLAAEVRPVTKEAEVAWRRQLLPLPHEMAVTREVAVPPGEIALVLRQKAGDVEQTGLAELQALFKEKSGAAPAGDKFRIIIGVLDAKGMIDGVKVSKASRLKALSNKEQAYLIQPQGDNLLVVAALHEKGAYYGMRTLYQLLERDMTPKRVVIPLAEITDWPDFNSRGLWNYADGSLIPYYAAMKLNFVYCSAGLRPSPVRRDAPIGFVDLKVRTEPRRLHAMETAFMITHVNFLDLYYGLYAAYPELAGQGGRAWQKANPNPKHRVPCATNPLFAKVLTEMMSDAAAQDVRDFSVWLSEFDSQCECPNCLKMGQSAAESAAAIAAWREVRAKYPDFELRLFYAITPPKDQIVDFFSKMPLEVKQERCGLEVTVAPGGRYRYHNPGFDQFAARGGWVASYDVPARTMYGYNPHKTRDFIRQLYERKWQGAYGYGPIAKLDDFGLGAVAEWSWNVNGRSEKEYATAWATRRGYAHPEAFGEWIDLIGPVHWDCSTYARDSLLTGLARKIKNRPDKPVDSSKYPDGLALGASSLEYFRTRSGFDEKIAVVMKALPFAEATERPEVVAETHRTIAHLRLLKSNFQILEQCYASDLSQEKNRAILRQAWEDMKKASDEQMEALRQCWDGLVAPMKPAAVEARVAERAKIMDEVGREIAPLLTPVP